MKAKGKNMENAKGTNTTKKNTSTSNAEKTSVPEKKKRRRIAPTLVVSTMTNGTATSETSKASKQACISSATAPPSESMKTRRMKALLVSTSCPSQEASKTANTSSNKKKTKNKNDSDKQEKEEHYRIQLSQSVEMEISQQQAVGEKSSSSSLPACRTVEINTHADLQRLFVDSAQIASKTRSKWARDPDADWIVEMREEILSSKKDTAMALEATEKLRALHKKIELEGCCGSSPIATTSSPSLDEENENIFGKWMHRAEFATEIINLWLRDKTLDEVMDRVRALGQDKLEQGYLLRGSMIANGDKDGHYIGLKQTELSKVGNVLPLVQSLCRRDGNNASNSDGDDGGASVSLYAVDSENHFNLHPKQTMSLANLADQVKKNEHNALNGCGSLNTTYDYGTDDATTSHQPSSSKAPLSGQPLLDNFYEEMEELTEGLSDCVDGAGAVELNRRLYFIWKGEGYMTPYHQDTHVPPQITIYNQLSGTSVFHFLPVLLGMYVTFVGKNDPQKAKDILEELNNDTNNQTNQMGTLAVLKGGDVAMILPYGSHGVFVPVSSSTNVKNNNAASSSNAGSGMSCIRAAEFFVLPVLRHYQNAYQQMGEDWCTKLMPFSKSDQDMAQQFHSAQVDLMKNMGIDRQIWHFHARRMLQQWEKEKENEQSTHTLNAAKTKPPIAAHASEDVQKEE